MGTVACCSGRRLTHGAGQPSLNPSSWACAVSGNLLFLGWFSGPEGSSSARSIPPVYTHGLSPALTPLPAREIPKPTTPAAGRPHHRHPAPAGPSLRHPFSCVFLRLLPPSVVSQGIPPPAAPAHTYARPTVGHSTLTPSSPYPAPFSEPHYLFDLLTQVGLAGDGVSERDARGPRPLASELARRAGDPDPAYLPRNHAMSLVPLNLRSPVCKRGRPPPHSRCSCS